MYTHRVTGNWLQRQLKEKKRRDYEIEEGGLD